VLNAARAKKTGAVDRTCRGDPADALKILCRGSGPIRNEPTLLELVVKPAPKNEKRPVPGESTGQECVETADRYIDSLSYVG
jgi:hypothetical protein